MRKQNIIFAALITGLMLFSNSVFATNLGLGISGVKTFQLNGKVGPATLKFNSSAPLEDIEGNVDQDADISSRVVFNPSNIEKAEGKISFKVKDINTGISTRDEHLQSADWLDASSHPSISFTLTGFKNVGSVKKSGDKAVFKATATGKYSMHGVSKSIDVPVEITYVKESAATKKRAPGDFLMIEGDFEVALKDFNVTGAKGIVGSKVGETIDVEFKLFYNGN